jgi:lipid-A-disaccharide synthase-like uncharacterized protein
MDKISEALRDPWVILGLAGQALFMMRFIVQWLSSEKAKRSVIPNAFWFFSLGGGAVLFLYALHKHDLVFGIGQGLGLGIYLRNFVLITRAKRRATSDTPLAEALRLIDGLQTDIHKLADLRTRPLVVDEALARLQTLIAETSGDAL